MTAGAVATGEIRQRYKLESILTSVNGNIGALTPRRTLRVLLPALLGRSFTVKLHAGPSRLARMLIKSKIMRVTYIYRDPRDALLSAFEYGQRARQAGRENAFSVLADIPAAIGFMQEYSRYWQEWMAVPDVHTLRYEDFSQHYLREAGRLANYLGQQPDAPPVQQVIDRYRPERAAEGAAGLHFQKGVSGRFREALTAEEQQRCNDSFAEVLTLMGYELE